MMTHAAEVNKIMLLMTDVYFLMILGTLSL